MDLFKSRLYNRIAIGKVAGIIFGGLAFFILPLIFSDADLFLRFGVWFWYISLGAFVGVFGVMDRIPVLNISFPYWFRGSFLGAWMNFVLILFIHDKLATLMLGTAFDGYSPFWLILEGLIFGLITDLLATKFAGEGKGIVG